MRFLFAIWEGGGCVPPTMHAARALVERGHEVQMLCDHACATDARAAGAEVRGWQRAPNRKDRTTATEYIRGWEAATEMEEMALLRDRLLVGPAEAYARDVMAALEAFDADVVVANDLLFGAMLGAEAVGKPLVLLAPNLSMFPLPGMPPVGPGFFPAQNEEERARNRHVAAGSAALMNEGLPQFNAARASLGLAPLGSLLDVVAAADRVLLATSEAFDYPAGSLPKNFRYIGPLLQQPSWATAKREERADVLIAFSTTYQSQEQAMRHAVEAMRGLPVRALATLGPALEDSGLQAPHNVKVVRAADHDAVLAQARVVITHAGHGTVMRALRHGVPLICLPMGRDQNDNAARVAFHGAGVRLQRAADAAEIRDAVEHVLADAKFGAAARRLQREILAVDSAARFVEEIEALAAEEDNPAAVSAMSVSA